MTENEKVIRIENLAKVYQMGEIQVHALRGVSFSVARGEVLAIMGPSGSGKSTLMNMIGCLDIPSSGDYYLEGELVSSLNDDQLALVRNRKIGFVFQKFNLLARATALSNVELPLRYAGINGDRKTRAQKALESVGLGDRIYHQPNELSGGQQQRVAIARALVKDSPLLLLDEPLVNLDYKLREELREELLNIFAERESIVIYTTTEPTEALMLGGNIVVMHEGRILQHGPTSHVYQHPALTKVAEVLSDPPINFITAQVEGDRAALRIGIDFPLTGHLVGLEPGEYTFGVRTHHFFLQRKSEEDIEIVSRVELAEINGSETFVHFWYRDRSLVVQEKGVHSFTVGDTISVFVHPGDFFIFDKDGNLLRAPERSALTSA